MTEWANELNSKFSEEEIQMTNKYMKQCSTALAIKEKQVKTTLRFHLTPVEIGNHQEYKQHMLARMQRGKEPSHTVGGNVNYCNHYGNQHGCSWKN
jgi:hypothetical protein